MVTLVGEKNWFGNDTFGTMKTVAAGTDGTLAKASSTTDLQHHRKSCLGISEFNFYSG
jgi:hypothetical protein